MQKLIVFSSFLLLPLLVLAGEAGTITGDYNSFSASNYGSYTKFTPMVFLADGTPYAHGSCYEPGQASYSNKTLEELTFTTTTLPVGEYKMIVGSYTSCSESYYMNLCGFTAGSFAECEGAGTTGNTLSFTVEGAGAGTSTYVSTTIENAINYADFAVDIVGFAILCIMLLFK